jgi:hypothetical protein
MSGHGPHIEPNNKRVALLIALLALVLAFSETLGKSAQTAALTHNIEASNLWSFFQAKTIRMTTLRTAAESIEATPGVGEAAKGQVAKWRATAARYDSEPDTGEGRKELMARAKEQESKRDKAMAAYHHFELASALVQIAIVLSSAMIITGIAALGWVSIVLGGLGIVFSGIGFFAPTAVHLF